MRTLKGKGRITDVNVAATVKEIRRALMDADVNYKVAKEITDRIKDEAMGQKIVIAVDPGQMLVKIVHDELVKLMGSQVQGINLKSDPSVILIAGLQGSGKTTFSGKLAQYLKKSGRNVLLVACDIYRPAAIDQLKVLGEQVEVEVYSEPENKNAVQIAQNALEYARKMGKKVIIVDTAGRLAVDEAMMNEIAAVKEAIKPSETLFVVDAMQGQDAMNVAKAFSEALPITGIVLTKTDGDSRGGAALSARYVTGAPIKFAGTSEKLDGIEVFDAQRHAGRVLGMGDIVALVEQVTKGVDMAAAEKFAQKMKTGGGFDLEDFLAQIQQMKQMGGLSSLMDKLPSHMSAKAGAMDMDKVEKDIGRKQGIIHSMTPKERSKPELIKATRKRRIAAGAGVQVQDVNRMLKEFEQMQDMMKKMSGGGMMKMMKRMGAMKGMMGGGGGFPGMPR